MLHTPPRPKFPSVSLYNELFSSYSPILGKVHRTTLNGLDKFKVKNTNIHATHIHKASNFCPFRSTINCFWVFCFFWKSPPNDPTWPWHVQGQKYQYAGCIHPRGPNFRLFQSAPNDPKMANMQHSCYIYPPPLPPQIFVRFALWWAIFELCLFFPEKCT